MAQPSCPGDRRARSSVALVLAAGVLVLAHPALAEDFEASASLQCQSLKVENLIGEVTIEGWDGSTFEVVASIQGADATRQSMRLETVEGTNATVRIIYPKGEDEFVYPRLGRGSRSTFSLDDRDREDGWLSALLGGGDRISVRGSGRGTETWADLSIKVPRGKELDVKLGVGAMSAEKIEGAVSLLTHSGAIEAFDITGDVSLDSGSGSVKSSDVKGNLSIDTGSGQVNVDGVKGSRVSIDTGSGSVSASGIECEHFVIDTGSGSIESIGCAADDAKFDTGSGSIEVAFTRMGGGSFMFDTGSGGVDVLLPDDVSVMVDAETGAGNIQVDVHRPTTVDKQESSVRFTLGDGDARMHIDSGSGTIRIAQPS